MELRRAVPADALAVARVHVRAWQAGYHELLPAAYLEPCPPASGRFQLRDPRRT
jgi:hypothetical protein